VKKIEMYKLIKARSGINTVIIKQENEKQYYLHSTVDPIQEANEWLSHIQLEEYTVYVVFGCALGYHVRTLWDSIPKNSILVVILTRVEYNLAMKKEIKGPLYNLQNKRLFMYEAIELYNIAVEVADNMVNHDIKKIRICKYYPAMRIESDFYALCEKNLVALVGEKMMLAVNINMFTGWNFIENYWRNIPYIATNPGIANFKNTFRGWPCIVVSGGPSLSKNINILKDCLPYAVVIASGSTMVALHKQGITPHFLVVTDASHEMFDCLDGYCNEHTVLLASIEVHHKVVSMYPGRRCFAYTIDDDRNIFADYLPQTARLRQTSSVATVAVDFAQHCGAEMIIMVGQDLAFAGDNYHADGIKTTGYMDQEMVEVPGYYGGMVPTVYSFKTAIEYLETYVRMISNIRFINATEGGAKIAGMEQFPLDEVKNMLLGKILPIEDKITGIFKEFGAQKFKVGPLINEMVQCQRQYYNVLQLFENYDKEYPNFRMISEDIDVMIAKIQDLGGFLNVIKNHAAALSYKLFLNPRLQLVEFYKQDGEPSSLIYGLYVEIFDGLQDLINKLYQGINENINCLENK